MTDTERFAGTDRFAVEARLGSGGFGVVYAAYDCEREARVALKVLRHAKRSVSVITGRSGFYRLGQGLGPAPRSFDPGAGPSTVGDDS